MSSHKRLLILFSGCITQMWTGYSPSIKPSTQMSGFLNLWEAASSMLYTSGTVTDGNTSLQPFRSRAKSGFWTSNALRSTRALNYAYEGLGEENVTSVINGLHTAGTSVAGPDQEVLGGLAKKTDEVHGSMLRLDDGQAAGPQIKLTKHFASIQLDAGALNGSFTIFFSAGTSTRPTPRSGGRVEA